MRRRAHSAKARRPRSRTRAGAALVLAFTLASTAHGDDPASDVDMLRSLRDGGRVQPIAIQSGELELRALPDESRVIVFVRDVVVKTGATELRADELEAYYPPDASEPDRLLARGHVSIDQPGQRATCSEAEYLRAGERFICRGNARLSRGCDVVEGESIEVDLAGERARVVGEARVVIAPRSPLPGCSGDSPPGIGAPPTGTAIGAP